ncbi:ERAD-associated E3 ubiquitin-protein ligase doa10 [Smittium culicis]|uniref:RING-type E3 ubiquitin transferase n=1 Tax=Smittium culicis TaxID=133412 RepID=A0A1R1Y810_9FUNG|nr:ERAD-associated E3 ubiquitin-protein ligase doa10 [Smittium culicis]OMJ25578.1 ERAD-associated E3 ubiquitin-protein ligase doa10 [Smittium culicis]
MSQEDIICRVCRGENTEEEPLFHPCKCSGSIKYVHQDCLLEWLEHSKKKSCELCGHNYDISPVYSENMPSSLPIFVVLKRLFFYQLDLIVLILRSLFVLFLWLILLPNIVVYITRFYFWSADVIVYGDSPSTNPIPSFFNFSNTTQLSNSTLSQQSPHSIPQHNFFVQAFAFIVQNLPLSKEFILNLENINNIQANSFTSFLKNSLNLSLDNQNSKYFHQALNYILSNSFYGSAITLSSVVVFMGLFFLRDWILNNQFAHDDNDNEHDNDDTIELDSQDDSDYTDNSSVNDDPDLPDFFSFKNPKSNLIQAPSSSSNPVSYDIPSLNIPSLQYPDLVQSSSSNLNINPQNLSNPSESDIFDLFFNDANSTRSNSSHNNFNIPQLDLLDDFDFPLVHTSPSTNSLPPIGLNNHQDLPQNSPWSIPHHDNPLPIPHHDNPLPQPLQDNQLPQPLQDNPLPQPLQDNPWPEAQQNILDDEPQMLEVADGILGAIGIRGAFATGVQYLLVVLVLVTLVIGFCVWFPYVIGKLIISLQIIPILSLPLYALLSLLNFLTSSSLSQILSFAYVTLLNLALEVRDQFISSSMAILSTLGDYLHNLLGTSAFAKIVFYLKNSQIFSTTQSFFASLKIESFLSKSISNVYTLIYQNCEPYFNLFESLTPSQSASESSIILPLMTGYALILFISYLFTLFSSSKNSISYKSSAMLLKMFKVVSFLTSELFFFPFMIGLVIDFCTLGLVAGDSLLSRIEFTNNHLYSSVFLHWIIGAAYMFKISSFVNSCRILFRPGVLWFIRNPLNPDYQPLSEILDRSTYFLTTRLLFSGAVYLLSILIFIGIVSRSLLFFSPTHFPLDFSEKIINNQIPLSITLVHFILPGLLIKFRSHIIPDQLFSSFWKYLSHHLRLTEFLLGYIIPNEIGTLKFQDWNSFFSYYTSFSFSPNDIIDISWFEIAKKFEIPINDFKHDLKLDPEFCVWSFRIQSYIRKLEKQNGNYPEHISNSIHPYSSKLLILQDLVNSIFQDYYPGTKFQVDGQFYRVPKTDNLFVVPKRKMIVPVNSFGKVLNPEHDYFLIDSLPGNKGARELQTRFGIFTRKDYRHKPENYKIVFSPRNIGKVFLKLLFLVVFSIMLFSFSSIYLPLLIGSRFYLLIFGHQANSFFSFCIGLAIILTALLILKPLALVLKNLYQLSKVFTSRFFVSSSNNQSSDTDPANISDSLKDFYFASWNISLVAFLFGIAVPALFGLVSDLYFTRMIRIAHFNQNPSLSHITNGNLTSVQSVDQLPLYSGLLVLDGSNLQSLLHEWIFGFLITRSVYGLIYIFPESHFAMVLDECLNIDNPSSWNAKKLFIKIFLPFLFFVSLTLSLPIILTLSLLNPTIQSYFNLARFPLIRQSFSESKASLPPLSIIESFFSLDQRILTFSCMFVFTFVSFTVLLGLVSQRVKKWVEKLKEEEYMVGQQLHNLQESTQ